MKPKVPESDLPRLYREVVEEIAYNRDCSCGGRGAPCPVCLSKTVMNGYDPWNRNHSNNQWDIDEIAAGEYLAYVSGYSNQGVGLELYPRGTKPLQAKLDPDLERLRCVSEQMPDCDQSVSGGDLIDITIIEGGGYTVTGHHGSKFR